MTQPTQADVMAQLAVVNADLQQLLQSVLVLNQQVAALTTSTAAPSSLDFSQGGNSEYLPLT